MKEHFFVLVLPEMLIWGSLPVHREPKLSWSTLPGSRVQQIEPRRLHLQQDLLFKFAISIYVPLRKVNCVGMLHMHARGSALSRHTASGREHMQHEIEGILHSLWLLNYEQSVYHHALQPYWCLHIATADLWLWVWTVVMLMANYLFVWQAGWRASWPAMHPGLSPSPIDKAMSYLAQMSRISSQWT